MYMPKIKLANGAEGHYVSQKYKDNKHNRDAGLVGKTYQRFVITKGATKMPVRKKGDIKKKKRGGVIIQEEGEEAIDHGKAEGNELTDIINTGVNVAQTVGSIATPVLGAMMNVAKPIADQVQSMLYPKYSEEELAQRQAQLDAEQDAIREAYQGAWDEKLKRQYSIAKDIGLVKSEQEYKDQLIGRRLNPKNPNAKATGARNKSSAYRSAINEIKKKQGAGTRRKKGGMIDYVHILPRDQWESYLQRQREKAKRGIVG